MGKLKEKHNHKLTDLLKVCIFGLVMLAPFGAVLSRCVYVAFNKNAKDSYTAPQIERYNRVTTSNNLLVPNQEYLFSYTQLFPQVTAYVYFNSISENIKSLVSNVIELAAFRLTGNANLVLIDTNGNEYQNYNYFTNPNAYKTFTFNYKETSLPNNLINAGELYLITENKLTLDNTFEYAIDQLGEMNITKWTKNTGIYTTVNQMTTGLGINTENNTMAILITYWFLMTCIYIIIDIIIFCFTKITHFMQ